MPTEKDQRDLASLSDEEYVVVPLNISTQRKCVDYGSTDSGESLDVQVSKVLRPKIFPERTLIVWTAPVWKFTPMTFLAQM